MKTEKKEKLTLRCMDYLRDGTLFLETVEEVEARNLPQFLRNYQEETDKYNTDILSTPPSRGRDPHDLQIAESIIYREMKKYNHRLPL
jgi:hypothetical protein